MKKPDFSKTVVGDIVYYYSKSGDLHKFKVTMVGPECFYAEGGPYFLKVSFDGVFDDEAFPRVFWQPLPDPPEECLKPPRRVRQEVRRSYINIYPDYEAIHSSEAKARQDVCGGALAIAVPVEITYTWRKSDDKEMPLLRQAIQE